MLLKSCGAFGSDVFKCSGKLIGFISC